MGLSGSIESWCTIIPNREVVELRHERPRRRQRLSPEPRSNFKQLMHYHDPHMTEKWVSYCIFINRFFFSKRLEIADKIEDHIKGSFKIQFFRNPGHVNSVSNFLIEPKKKKVSSGSVKKSWKNTESQNFRKFRGLKITTNSLSG